jgi:hypothetical protein
MARDQWIDHPFRSINWEVPSKALDNLESSAQIFIIKFAHGRLPTRRHMCLGEVETDKCPACLHIAETDWHILSWPLRPVWRTSLIATLTETLRINHTQSDLTILLLQGSRGVLASPTFQMSLSNREPSFQHSSAPRTKSAGTTFLKADLATTGSTSSNSSTSAPTPASTR